MIIKDDAILEQARRRACCEFCGTFSQSGLHPHHLFTRGAGQLDIPINLAALCVLCHHRTHSGHSAGPTKLQLLEIVAKREWTSVAAIEEEIWRLRRLGKRRIEA